MAKPGTFQKGNQLGHLNPGPARHNLVTQVIISQLHEVDKKTSKEKIHLLVDKLIQHALGYESTVKNKEGKSVKVQVPSDLAAIHEIIDRVEGKAAQGVVVSGDPENPLKVVQIERAVLTPGQWNNTKDSDTPGIRTVN